MVKRGKYDYPNLIGDYNLINLQIRKDIMEFCKKKGINKSKLIEEFYKSILIRFRDGSLNASAGYITLNILRAPITK
ncbi:MAG: hypothetical protein IMZ51_03965 [Chloroflexi bacterium]|nr:hypothetical protein [Chloroflexota bacterium]